MATGGGRLVKVTRRPSCLAKTLLRGRYCPVPICGYRKERIASSGNGDHPGSVVLSDGVHGQVAAVGRIDPDRKVARPIMGKSPRAGGCGEDVGHEITVTRERSCIRSSEGLDGIGPITTRGYFEGIRGGAFQQDPAVVAANGVDEKVSIARGIVCPDRKVATARIGEVHSIDAVSRGYVGYNVIS